MFDTGAFTDAVKHLLTDLLGLGRDSSHVQIGMMLFVGGVLALRGRGVTWIWGSLLALELVNEWIDSGFPATTTAGSVKDIITTMLGPTLLWLAIMWLSRRAAAPRSGEDREQSFE
jgi:hypothetical protein